MPLPNRVSPLGELVAAPARGTLFGNRGGRFHRDDRTLGRRRWTSRAWICCRLEFKGRHRDVWGRGFTDLFFLDEPTALAAGHRPCFECRRDDALAFAQAWARAKGRTERSYVEEMDRVLQAERVDGRAKRRHRLAIGSLPDGAVVALPDGAAYAVRGDTLLRWSPEGYTDRTPRLRGVMIDVLTPPGIVRALAAGYRPQWHPSA
jgi:hypothetical protein